MADRRLETETQATERRAADQVSMDLIRENQDLKAKLKQQ